ncbi:phospholipase D [Leptinotarsa decemlineata]|uniref:phospholipase D n=1 Tax=Leptinotarsa decemlineata TaxID=7539 RepID=UPI003D306B9D
MQLRSVLEYKFAILSSAAFIIIPYYTWKSFYRTYKSLKRQYDEEILFSKRHDCVVMYSSNKGMYGWPPYRERIVADITDENWCDKLYEPIIYFIDTAKFTLDVAIMMITIKQIYQALIDAQKRGVKVRILLNFEHSENMLPQIRECIKGGLDVQLYIPQKTNLSNIMHYKYMVKDYSRTGGYVLVGSMNFTSTAFLENYEDVVISSNHYIVTGFHNNFDKCFKFVMDDNESLINKTILLDVNLA